VKYFEKLSFFELTYVSTSMFMLKSYTRHVRSQIFPRIDVQKSIYPHEELISSSQIKGEVCLNGKFSY
jgi:hypothetical protein